ncbi:MAG: HD domain-containing phosphohydrolase [Bacillota bacterium]
MPSNNNQLFKAALENIAKGIIITDQNNQVIFANQTAEKLQNLSQTEVIGEDILSLYSDSNQEKIKQIINALQNDDTDKFTTIIDNHDQNKYLKSTYLPLKDSSNNYIGTLQTLTDRNFQDKFAEQSSNSLHKLEEQVDQLTKQLQQLFISSMTSLVKTLEAKDSYTKGHSLRVCKIATKIAQSRYNVESEIKKIKLAGKLHDIGKVGTQESILNKPDSLTNDEYNHIKQHPIMSEEILSPIKRFKSITKMVRHHHERYDGTGYPDQLSGTDIPVGSRIVAIADSYDAMTSNRPYRSPINPQDAVQEIKRNLGTQFDPEFGKIFLELFKAGKIEE